MSSETIKYVKRLLDKQIKYQLRGGVSPEVARERAIHDVWHGAVLNSNLRSAMFHILTADERLELIRRNRAAGAHNPNPTKQELIAWFEHDLRNPVGYFLHPITDKKLRLNIIELRPNYVWNLDPAASDHEIFVAIMRNPLVILQTHKHLDNYEKWLSLALVIADKKDIEKIQSHRETRLLDIAENKWRTYWRHLLNI